MEQKSIKALMRRLSGIMGEMQAMIEQADGSDRLTLQMAQPSIEAAYKAMLIASGELFPAAALIKKADKPAKQSFGEFQKVKLTDNEHKKLCAAYGADIAQKYIDALDTYIASKHARYEDHYATILSWMRRDGVLPKGIKTQSELTKQLMKNFVEG